MGSAVETPTTQHLSFTLAGEEYAVPLLRVKELVQYLPVTRLPNAAPAVRGVVNLRGRVVPVVDLAVQFGLRDTPITRFTCIVMLETDEAVVGVLADTVNDVLDLGAGDVEPPPAFGTSASAAYLVGMGKCGARLVLLLDVARVLSAAARGAPLTELTAAAAPEAEGAPAGDAPEADAAPAPKASGQAGAP